MGELKNTNIKRLTETTYFNDNKKELIPYLNKIKHRIKFEDYDCFIVVTGKERRGKSTLAAQLADYISDGQITQDQICMSMEEFLTALTNSKRGDVIIFDEAGTNLYSREAMSTINRMLTKAFMVSGLKNVCIMLCIPSFFSLDTYIRTHRIDLLFHVPQRGKFKVYSSKRAKEISILGAKLKKVEVVRCNLKGWFIKQYPTRIEKEYRLKERKYKLAYIRDVRKNIDGSYSLSKFAEITGFNTLTIHRWIKDNLIQAKKVGGRWFIPKTEAERVAEEKGDRTTLMKQPNDNDI